MSDYPGSDTIAVVTLEPTGDVDSLNKPITNPTVRALVYGCVFEPYSRGPVEEQTDTITAHERAWAFMPYVYGVGIPQVDSNLNAVVDDNGNPVPVVIGNADFLQPVRLGNPQAQRNYKIQGLPEVQYDQDGMPDHVWIICEWHGG
jgi:hypothetical protein